MSEFMDRARAEAEREAARRNRAAFENEGEYLSHTWGQGFERGFAEGAAWASEQEPTDEEVEAAAKAFHDHECTCGDLYHPDFPEGDAYFRSLAKAALLAAQKVRADR